MSLFPFSGDMPPCHHSEMAFISNGLLLWLVQLTTASQTANLAILWRRENGGLDASWDAVSCAAVLAVNHFNARDGSVVPEFERVPEGLQLHGMYYDAWSTASKAIIAYRNAVADGANAIVGPSRSAQVLIVSQLAAIDQVLIISPWASASRLSVTSTHPYFARTWPSDALVAAEAMRTITEFGWRNLGYVGVADAYSDGYKDTMRAWSVNNPGKAVITSVQTFPYNDPIAARESVRLLKGLGTKVNILLVFDADVYAVMSAAEEFGMLTDDYIWISSETTSGGSTQASYIPASGDPALLAGWLQGMIRLSFSPEGEKSPGYQRLAALWSTMTPSDCAFSSSDNTHFVPKQTTFDQAPWDVAPTMYDAVAASALALAATANWTIGAQARQGGPTSLHAHPSQHSKPAPLPM